MPGPRCVSRGGPCEVSSRPERSSPPHPHPGRACAARGSGPPTRPRISFMWGLRPHAPTRSAGLRRRRIAPSTPAPIDRSIGEHQAPRAHARPSPGSKPGACGRQPAAHPALPPPPANKAPRNPEWIVEGGCGGEPPLENTGGAGAARHRGQAPAGEPRSPPGTTPPPANKAPRNPKWIVEGGVWGGAPPLRTQGERAQPAIEGKRLRGNPAAHPAQPPPPAPAAPRNPKWIVEGGCGGEPPLENTGGVWGGAPP